MFRKIFPVFAFIWLLSTLCMGWESFQSYNMEERTMFGGYSYPDEDDFDSSLPRTKRDVKGNSSQEGPYDPTWESVDTRPLPSWYDDSKIGIFIHWGVYSVPAVRTEWFWNVWKRGNNNECENYVNRNYKPNFTYQEFGPDFTAEFYNPEQWADLFQRSGAKYVVLTSKHHEGYTLWPSPHSWGWNSMDIGAKRDLLGELATAIRANTTLKFGLYHSLYEWYNPLFLRDKENGFNTSEFMDSKVWPSLHELVNTYHPEVIWSDGEWEVDSWYWRAPEFLAWLYNESPVKDTVVTNDRWGGETLCRHGGFYTCADRYNPGVLQPNKWENCLTLDNSWGYRKNAKIEDYMTPEALMRTIVESVSCRGNVLVNVGPTKEGIISPVQQERLLQMGEWLEINGEGIYGSIPWRYQNDTVTPGVWYTASQNETKVYTFLTSWPQGDTVHLGSVRPSGNLTVSILGSTTENNRLLWYPANTGINVTMPNMQNNRGKWVWTLVLENVGEEENTDEDS